MQDLSDLSGGCVSALQQIHSLREKAELDVRTILFESEKLIARGLAAITENSILFSALTAGANTFKTKNQALLSKVNTVREKFASR